MHPDQLARDALGLDPPQRLLAEEVRGLVQVDHPRLLEPVAGLERVGLVGDVAAPGQDPGLDAPDVARADHLHPVRAPGLPDRLPQLHAVPGGVVQVDLVPELGGVAGARDDHLHPVQLAVHRVVVRNVQNGLAEQVHHHVPRLRPLHLHRADVGFADLHVHPEPVGQALGPQQHVAVGQRQPEVVLAQPQQHRVVDDPAVLVGHEHVLALPDAALVQVPRHEHVGELERVRAGDLHLPLHPDVPERHAFQQRPVLADRISVVPRVVGVVVDAVQAHPVLPGGVEERRLAQPGVLQDSGVRIHGHRRMLLRGSVVWRGRAGSRRGAGTAVAAG